MQPPKAHLKRANAARQLAKKAQTPEAKALMEARAVQFQALAKLSAHKAKGKDTKSKPTQE